MTATEAIAVTCTNCDTNFRVKPEAAGRSVKCPKCRNRTLVDGKSDEPEDDPAFEWLGLNDPIPVIANPPITATEVSVEENETDRDVPALPVNKITDERPIAAPVRNATIEPRKYPALNTLRRLYYSLAVLTGVQWAVVTLILIVGGLIGGVATGGIMLMMSIVLIVIHTAVSAVSACTLIASAEMIKLSLDIQSDTRQAAACVSWIHLNQSRDQRGDIQ